MHLMPTLTEYQQREALNRALESVSSMQKSAVQTLVELKISQFIQNPTPCSKKLVRSAARHIVKNNSSLLYHRVSLIFLHPTILSLYKATSSLLPRFLDGLQLEVVSLSERARLAASGYLLQEAVLGKEPPQKEYSLASIAVYAALSKKAGLMNMYTVCANSIVLRYPVYRDLFKEIGSLFHQTRLSTTELERVIANLGDPQELIDLIEIYARSPRFLPLVPVLISLKEVLNN